MSGDAISKLPFNTVNKVNIWVLSSYGPYNVLDIYKIERYKLTEQSGLQKNLTLNCGTFNNHLSNENQQLMSLKGIKAAAKTGTHAASTLFMLFGIMY